MYRKTVDLSCSGKIEAKRLNHTSLIERMNMKITGYLTKTA